LLGATILAAGTAMAQTEPDGTAAKPVKGGTLGQRLPHGSSSTTNPTVEEVWAKQRIHDAGYAGVISLQRMPDGSWDAQAFKNGAYHEVTLDHAGHVMQP